MKETGIIMSGNHPRLILDGIKTQTRRVVKGLEKASKNHQMYHFKELRFPLENYFDRIVPFYRNGVHAAFTDSKPTSPYGEPIKCPYGQVGDRLWVRHRYDLFDVYYKPIPGWDDNYAAGTDGHIYRMDGSEPYQLKECSTGNGYLGISLSQGSYKQTINVHRLICQAFYGEDDHQRSQTRHLDGNSLNNHPSNLDWGTQEDNWLDRKYHGRGMGEAHHASKLTRLQVTDIRLSHQSQRQLARRYNVSQATIQAVIAEKFWQEKGRQPLRNFPQWNGWSSPLFCPRWASRITLEITEVRVERVQDISIADAEAEGIIGVHTAMGILYKPAFSRLWDSLNAKRGYGWEVNPWVWVISFRRLNG